MGSDGFGRRRPSARRGAPKRCVRLTLQPLEERFAPAGMTKLGQWNNGTSWYSDGWAITQNGRQYAYIGHYGNNNGIHIVDITDPASPFLVSNFKSASGWNDFRDVELVQRGSRRTFGLFSSDIGGGLVIANVSNPANPVEVFRITSANGGTNNVHTLSVDGNYLYEADSRTSTIRVFDITNPANPIWLRNIVSSTEAVHEVTALNGRLYAAGIFNNPRVEIYDISQIGNLSVPVTKLGTILSGTRAHTAWPTEDGKFVAIAHEKEGGDLSFWDVSNPANPQFAWSITLPTTQAYCVHQVMIKGNRLYASWYQAGIRVYDITDRYNPVLLGDYDTFPGAVSGYNGAWGVYPYLGDSKILGFDMQGGMFLLSLDTRSNDGGGGEVSGLTPKITLAQNEEPIALTGGVLRMVLNNNSHVVNIKSNQKTRTIDVTIDGGQFMQFDAAEVMHLSIFGGDGDDRFIFDPSITQSIYLDGGAGSNTAEGWPALYASGARLTASDHCAQVMGVQRGQYYEARSVQLLKNGAPAALATSALISHAAHAADLTSQSNSSSVVTGSHAMALAGLSNGGMAGVGQGGLMGTAHSGGMIAPEFMLRTSTNSQVGGQVAYHKLG